MIVCVYDTTYDYRVSLSQLWSKQYPFHHLLCNLRLLFSLDNYGSEAQKNWGCDVRVLRVAPRVRHHESEIPPCTKPMHAQSCRPCTTTRSAHTHTFDERCFHVKPLPLHHTHFARLFGCRNVLSPTEPSFAFLCLGLYAGSLLTECGLKLTPYFSMYHHSQFNKGFDGEFFLSVFEHSNAHLAQQNGAALKRIGELDEAVQGARKTEHVGSTRVHESFDVFFL